MNQINIETTQHVKLSYNPAGVGDRILAYLLDGFVMFAYYLLVFTGFGYIMGSSFLTPDGSTTQVWIFILVLGIPLFLYHLISEVLWNGKTVGKWIIGIQVVKIDGTSPDLSNYLVRWMLRLVEVSMTFGLLAFISILVNGKGQRIGDVAAKTCVIKTRKKVKLSDTIYSATDADYEPLFPQVRELNDNDIRTIKEVLETKSRYEFSTWFVMVERTANIIQMKLGIQKADLKADEFLLKVIADYNHLHQS
ncbi:MAG: RDD family protein [Balneolaceae bacterium]